MMIIADGGDCLDEKTWVFDLTLDEWPHLLKEVCKCLGFLPRLLQLLIEYLLAIFQELH